MKRLAMIGFLVLAIVSTSFAGMKDFTKVGKWYYCAYTDDHTGKVKYYAAGTIKHSPSWVEKLTIYKKVGTSEYFATVNLMFAFTLSQHHLRVGFQVDRNRKAYEFAFKRYNIREGRYVWKGKISSSLIEEMRRGRELSCYFQRERRVFSLDGAAKVLTYVIHGGR